MDAQQLRTRIRQQREALGRDAILQAAGLMAKHLFNADEFIKARHIAHYLAVKGEADPAPLVTSTMDSKTFYLPVIHNQDKVGLNFVRADDTTTYKANRYGIPEPVHQPGEEIKPQQLDLIITPLVAFDNHGNRIGMGGGFYDRTFAFKRDNQSQKPFLIGYAYDFQRTDNISPEPWDVALDGIVTESGFKRFR